jgi:hypothetical protein
MQKKCIFIQIQKFNAKANGLSNLNCRYFLQARVFIKPTIPQNDCT